MKEIIKQLREKNYDAYTFFPTEDGEQIKIEGSSYTKPGEKLDYNEIGDCYHIILFREDTEGKPQDLEKFDAILVSPADYISTLIPGGWSGGIYKKTTTSQELVTNLFDSLNKVC